ncbi:kazrin-like isoform X3 [Tachypleus tridentatus]|uniref:kazrin-like isoform X3 n=1 Tax=Tachypleus tridentatus TaxID=6853 RepID=UPI003FD175F5
MAEGKRIDNIDYNKAIITALQSLDSLNDQIVQYIFTPKSAEFDVDSDSCDEPPTAIWQQQQEALKSSMALMRRLLVDAQAKFRKMMEDNKDLASRIDGDIHNAHQEVSLLRAELADTNKRIAEINTTGNILPVSSTESIMAGNVLTTCLSAPKNNVSSVNQSEPNCNINSVKAPPSPSSNSNCPNNPSSNNGESDSVKQTSPISSVKDNYSSSLSSTTATTNSITCDRCKNCTHEDTNQLEERLCQQEDLNRRLGEENRSLQRELEELRVYKESAQEEELRPQTRWLENELKHAKEALAALKQDRKRLKAEKFDLLNQMKQLYGTLEDKENELRDFIRNYEQRMKESEEGLKQLVRAKEECEHEKWNILKHARDEAERSVALCAQLGLKDAQIRQLREELCTIRDRMGYSSDAESTRIFRTNGYHSPSMASTSQIINGRDSSNAPTPTPLSEPTSLLYTGTPTITVDEDQNSVYYSTTSARDDRLPSLSGLSRSAEEIHVNTNANSDVSSVKKSRKRKEGKGTWGSISRVFSRGRRRKGLDTSVSNGGSSDQRSSWSPQSSLYASPLTEGSYNEKLKLLEEAQGIPMEKWKAATVLSWLEITLGMPQYGSKCSENIKSGKILLELSDGELEVGLGITNAMHRRKLRLAIEEHRDSSSCMNPKINLLSHVWVVDEWLPSLGLATYRDPFNFQLVDGRVLNTLTKKDLEKYLNITRKFHQLSVMHGIQLLRMVKFDKQVLTQRRSRCEHMDLDPLVWTNQRFIKWVKSIDLEEYAENLQGSGVHGALVVLETSFTADTMAMALGIPTSKNIIRRHLTTELDSLIQPSRMSLEAEAVFYSRKNQKKSAGTSSVSATGSLGRSFMRSHSRATLERTDKRHTNTRGSRTRNLGLTMKQEFHKSPNLQSSCLTPKQVDSHRRVKSHGHTESFNITSV